MRNYQIRYANSFRYSLKKIISYWLEDLGLSETQVSSFVKSIDKALKNVQSFPRLGTDVTDKYGFTETTYRISVGHRYGIFYRVNTDNQRIEIGSIFSCQQMKVEF